MKFFISLISGILVFAGLGYALIFLNSHASPEVAAASITAASAIVVSAATVAFGRYWEKRKELEALHREKKIPIYGKFLDDLLSIFYEQKSKKVDQVRFLQEWQKQILVWGGSSVVNAYIKWKTELTTHEPNARTIESTEKLVRAIREELGHNDEKLTKGIFAHVILREADLYLTLSKKNQNLTLAELAENEKIILEAKNSARK